MANIAVQRRNEASGWQGDVLYSRGRWPLEFWCRSRDFVDPYGFHPFGGDGVPFHHRHTSIGREHLWPTTPSPRQKTEEMVFADGLRAGWRIGICKAVCHATTSIVHLNNLSKCEQYAGQSC